MATSHESLDSAPIANAASAAETTGYDNGARGARGISDGAPMTTFRRGSVRGGAPELLGERLLAAATDDLPSSGRIWFRHGDRL